MACLIHVCSTLPHSEVIGITYIFSNGWCGFGVVMWRNSLVGYDLQRMTSVFLHLSPVALAPHYWFAALPNHHRLTPSAGLAWSALAQAVVWFLAAQVVLLISIWVQETWQTNTPNSYTFMYSKFSTPVLGLLRHLPFPLSLAAKIPGPFLYAFFCTVYFVVAGLMCIALAGSRATHTAFMWGLFLVAVRNGHSYHRHAQAKTMAAST